MRCPVFTRVVLCRRALRWAATFPPAPPDAALPHLAAHGAALRLRSSPHRFSCRATRRVAQCARRPARLVPLPTRLTCARHPYPVRASPRPAPAASRPAPPLQSHPKLHLGPGFTCLYLDPFHESCSAPFHPVARLFCFASSIQPNRPAPLRFGAAQPHLAATLPAPRRALRFACRPLRAMPRPAPFPAPCLVPRRLSM